MSEENSLSEKPFKKYVVQKGETLMLIAYKEYGDIDRWVELKKINPQITKVANIKEGQIINLIPSDTTFTPNTNGAPYLIIPKDTLYLISYKKYGTTKNWKSIYENNRQMIKNPNMIYAGFTLYILESFNRLPANKN